MRDCTQQIAQPVAPLWYLHMYIRIYLLIRTKSQIRFWIWPLFAILLLLYGWHSWEQLRPSRTREPLNLRATARCRSSFHRSPYRPRFIMHKPGTRKKFAKRIWRFSQFLTFAPADIRVQFLFFNKFWGPSQVSLSPEQPRVATNAPMIIYRGPTVSVKMARLCVHLCNHGSPSLYMPSSTWEPSFHCAGRSILLCVSTISLLRPRIHKFGGSMVYAQDSKC